jgi:UDP-N-acetyl-D-glucosamine dehydrogenase
MRVAVIGLGYVGLPLAVLASQARHQVLGIDIDSRVINALSKGKSHIEDVPDSQLCYAIEELSLDFTTEFGRIRGSEIILICVPTPLTNDFPDLSYVEQAMELIMKSIESPDDVLIILESTTSPGSTRRIYSNLLIKYFPDSNLEMGLLAFSPERIDPGSTSWSIENTPKILGANNSRASDLAFEFYSTITTQVYICDSIEVAELAKLYENTFRLVNISLANQFAILCSNQGIDVFKVLEAASTKPYGFLPFFPGLGAGGHCIPVDPVYLEKWSADSGQILSLIREAISINSQMPVFATETLEKLIGSSLSGVDILILGIGYKLNSPDIRESAGIKLMHQLRERGANVFWYDPKISIKNLQIDVFHQMGSLMSDFGVVIVNTISDFYLPKILPKINKEAKIVFARRSEHKSSLHYSLFEENLY